MTALSKEFDEKFDAIDRDYPNAWETSKQLTAQHSKRLSELFGKYTIQIAPFLKDVNERERELAELFDNQKSALPSTLRPDH